jgi:hypothetical protein
MSFQAMAWAVKQRTGDPLAKLLLLVLANYANERNESWPSMLRLADDTQMSKRSVVNKLAELEESGLLTKRTELTPMGSISHNVYRLQLGSAPDALPVHDVHEGSAPHAPNTINEPIIPSTPRARLTTLPEDWEPNAALYGWAVQAFPNLDVNNEVSRFRDYWLGNGKPHANWDATFRNWCRRAITYQKSSVVSYARAERTSDNDRRIDEYLRLRNHSEQGSEPKLIGKS